MDTHKSEGSLLPGISTGSLHATHAHQHVQYMMMSWQRAPLAELEVVLMLGSRVEEVVARRNQRQVHRVPALKYYVHQPCCIQVESLLLRYRVTLARTARTRLSTAAPHFSTVVIERNIHRAEKERHTPPCVAATLETFLLWRQAQDLRDIARQRL